MAPDTTPPPETALSLPWPPIAIEIANATFAARRQTLWGGGSTAVASKGTHFGGAERIIAMSRHESRQNLAPEFGATDVVTERGDEGVKELTDGLGAHSVIEAVDTRSR